jgi:transposase
MSEVARLRAENARLRAALAQQQEAHRQEVAVEKGRTTARETELLQLIAQLNQRNRQLGRQAWGRKSEQSDRGKPVPRAAGLRPQKTSEQFRGRVKPGPKPFDPALPRVKIKLPDPDPQARLCPLTGEPMRPGFTETIEVLQFIPAQVVVQVLERTVFVSAAKSAPVYTPWPDDVLARQRVHASVLAHLAAEHYSEHQPFNRLEKKLQRAGVRLPRATQVACMAKLNELAQPVVAALKDDLMQKDYLHLDATPMRLSDPARPGRTVEATIWGYRANDEPLVWYQFEYQRGKSPDHPDRELKAADFAGLLQVDGAGGLNQIGVEGQIIALGCLAHGRRYAYNAVVDGEQDAGVYLELYNKIFKIDRIAQRFQFGAVKRDEWRLRYSLPLFELMVAIAEGEKDEVLPGTLRADCIHYLLAQQEYLRRCLTVPGAELTNNACERALRPLKTGLRNWQRIGHPSAGPRFGNLFTLVENCRQVGVNIEAYLTDLITQLPSHPAKKIAELLPAAWQRARVAEKTEKTAADPPPA